MWNAIIKCDHKHVTCIAAGICLLGLVLLWYLQNCNSMHTTCELWGFHNSEDEDPILLAWIILDISTPEDKDTMLPEHVRIKLPSDAVPLPYPRRMESSIANTHYVLKAWSVNVRYYMSPCVLVEKIFHICPHIDSEFSVEVNSSAQ